MCVRKWKKESEVAQSCPTLCNPVDCSLPGSSIHGILQARVLEWVAISFSNAWKWKVKGKSLSRVRLLVTLWTAAYQVPPSMGFSRQDYWSGVPLPSLQWDARYVIKLNLYLLCLLSKIYICLVSYLSNIRKWNVIKSSFRLHMDKVLSGHGLKGKRYI